MDKSLQSYKDIKTFDEEQHDVDSLTEIREQFNKESCIDGIIVVFRKVNDRWTDIHNGMIGRLTQLIGPGWISHAMILFTRDDFRKETVRRFMRKRKPGEKNLSGQRYEYLEQNIESFARKVIGEVYRGIGHLYQTFPNEDKFYEYYENQKIFGQSIKDFVKEFKYETVCTSVTCYDQVATSETLKKLVKRMITFNVWPDIFVKKALKNMDTKEYKACKSNDCEGEDLYYDDNCANCSVCGRTINAENPEDPTSSECLEYFADPRQSRGYVKGGTFFGDFV